MSIFAYKDLTEAMIWISRDREALGMSSDCGTLYRLISKVQNALNDVKSIEEDHPDYLAALARVQKARARKKKFLFFNIPAEGCVYCEKGTLYLNKFGRLPDGSWCFGGGYSCTVCDMHPYWEGTLADWSDKQRALDYLRQTKYRNLKVERRNWAERSKK